MSGLEAAAALVSFGTGIIGGIQQAQAQAAQARAQAEQITAARDVEEQRRREALKREQAARLARFGRHGVAGTGGSADAVRAGLAAASARRGAEADALDRLRLNALNSQAAYANRINLLDQVGGAARGLGSLQREGHFDSLFARAEKDDATT